MQSLQQMLPQPAPDTQSTPDPPVFSPINDDPRKIIESEIELLEYVLETLDTTKVVDELNAHYTTGRRGYSKSAMWRAYVASFVLGCRYTNDLIRRLKGDPALREICGFGRLPVRTTFNRFINGLADHDEIIEQALVEITDRLHDVLPELGQTVAIDSTAIKTYANPRRYEKTDPDARPGVKHVSNSAQGKTTEWFVGYKAHMITDATYGIPLTVITTPGNVYDGTKLEPMLNKSDKLFDWFGPEIMIADRGYDSKKNTNLLYRRGTKAVIKAKDMRPVKDGEKQLIRGVWDQYGVPHCTGGAKMEFVMEDPDRGYLYRCPNGGCKIIDNLIGCQVEIWQNPLDDLRLFGIPRRESPEWKEIYGKRYAVERPFKSAKQHRRLEHHTIRGLAKMRLHVLMCVLTFNATVLVNHRMLERESLMWMVPRVP